LKARIASVKKYLTGHNIAVLTRITMACALAFLSVSVAPGFAATLLRGADVCATQQAVWSMIAPLTAIRDWLPPRPGARGGAANA
jgi:hypothetical protein